MIPDADAYDPRIHRPRGRTGPALRVVYLAPVVCLALGFGVLGMAPASARPAARQGGDPGPAARTGSAAGGVVVDIELPDVDEIRLVRRPQGELFYAVHRTGGSVEELSPEEFSRLVYRRRSTQPWWGVLLNVSSWGGIAWVGLGFLGQLMFSGRMLVQWVASERRKRSFVPVAFWWMSLAGASMVLVYFLWRRDPVGIVGQLTGWTIYLRNLWFIYRGQHGTLAPPLGAEEAQRR